MKLNKKIVIVLVIAFFLRLLPIDFPMFTADEARIAIRGYTLSKNGADELGRKLPLIFNSIDDYQLPLTSYITALGVGLFGKSEVGARLPFIFIGVMVVWLAYLTSSVFNPNQKFRLITALITALSPPLIFLSKVPNEEILIIFLLLLLFYYLTREKIKFAVVLVLISLLLLVSKLSWFIVAPFVIFTLLFYQDNTSKKNNLIICISSLGLTFIVVYLFLWIPQALRSFSENNFTLFFDTGIKNGINTLRGQGIESGWPGFLEKLLFNKLHFLSAGFLNWLSNLQPSIFFSQFDKTGQFGFVGMGAWPKILIIPLLAAVISLIKKGDRKHLFLPGYFLILTFPIFFIYPKQSPNVAVTTLPFMSILITLGLSKLRNSFRLIILGVMILEVLINLSYLTPEIKNTNNLRPAWVKKIVLDGYMSSNYSVAFSDDIADDLIPFIEWHTPVNPPSDNSKIDFPYKFRQYRLSNIRLIGHEDNFYNCGFDKPSVIFASSRDLNRIQNEFKVNIDKIYQDSLINNVVYKLEPKVCIK